MGTNSRKTKRGITNKDIQHWAYELANDPEFNTGEIGPDAERTQVLDPVEIVFNRNTGEQSANRTINGGDKIYQQAMNMSRLKARRLRRQLRTSPENRAPLNYEENREWVYEHATPELRGEMDNTLKFADIVTTIAGLTGIPLTSAAPMYTAATDATNVARGIGSLAKNGIGKAGKWASRGIYRLSPKVWRGINIGARGIGTGARNIRTGVRTFFDAAFRPSFWTNKINNYALAHGGLNFQTIAGLANRMAPYADIATNLYWDYESGKDLYDMATKKTQFSPIGAAWDIWILKNSPRVLKGTYQQAKWDYNSLKDRYGFLADPRSRTFGGNTKHQLIYDTGSSNPIGRQNIPPMNGVKRLGTGVEEPITTDIGIRVSPNGEVVGYRDFDGHTLRINPETGNPQLYDDVVNSETYRNLGKGLGLTAVATTPLITTNTILDYNAMPYDPNNYAKKYGVEPDYLPSIYETKIKGENLNLVYEDMLRRQNLISYLAHMDYIKNIPQFPVLGEGNYDKNKWLHHRFFNRFQNYYDEQINNVENGGTYVPLSNDIIQNWLEDQRTDSIWDFQNLRYRYLYSPLPSDTINVMWPTHHNRNINYGL